MAFDESESLSDIDDAEEQAAKEAAAKEACHASSYSCLEDMQAAQELAAAAVAKSRKEKQPKRPAEARNAVPAQTAVEATREMLTKKRLSPKVNYDVLERLFDESPTMYGCVFLGEVDSTDPTAFVDSIHVGTECWKMWPCIGQAKITFTFKKLRDDQLRGL